MAGFFDPVGRAERQHAADTARVAGFQSELEKLVAATPQADDFDGLVSHEAKVAEVNRKIAIARGVADHSKATLQREQASAAKRAADAKHTEMQRRAQEATKRFSAIFGLQRALAAEIAWAAKHVAEVATYNLNERGDREFIRDAEDLIRRLPEINEPEIAEFIEVWVDEHGREASQYVKRDGETVPAGWDRHHKVTRQVVTRSARYRPSQLPTRLSEAVKLVDIDGSAIWPAQ